MDVQTMIERIDKEYSNVQEKINNVKVNYNIAATTVNDKIGDIELTINDAIKKYRKGMAGIKVTIQDKVNVIAEDLNETMETINFRLNELMNDIKTGYNNTMSNTKIRMIKALFAKLGENITDEYAEEFINAIPINHPSIDSLLPEFNFEIPIPDVTEVLDDPDVDEVELKRLPMLKVDGDEI